MGRPHCGGGYPYDRTFTDMARQETRPIAANAARWIEYPIAGLALEGSDWRPGFVIRPFLLGALGVGLVLGIRQLHRSRRPRTPAGCAGARTPLDEAGGGPDPTARRTMDLVNRRATSEEHRTGPRHQGQGLVRPA